MKKEREERIFWARNSLCKGPEVKDSKVVFKVLEA